MHWETYVRRVEPYVPGEQPAEENIIKLNTNECPYPPAPKVKEAMERMDTEQFRRYPDPDAAELTAELAAYYGVKESQVFAGVGSDDVLAMAFLTFFNSAQPVLFPDITYSFYDVWAELFRIPYGKIPVDERFHICPEDYNRPNGGIIFPNPNAPTGLLETLETVEAIVRANPDSVVIVDEAYIDFGGKSSLALLPKYENLLVVQTFSKSRAMAGIRIGFAIGSEKLICCLKDVKFSFNSYTLNRPALVCGVAAVREDDYFRETTGRIAATRERVKVQLRDLGFTFPDSCANFIFASHESVPAAELFEALKREHIYVRYFAKPRIDNYLRITIGTDEEMDALLAFLRRYLS